VFVPNTYLPDVDPLHRVLLPADPNPLSADAPDLGPSCRSYLWILNWLLSFGPAQWDAVAVLPEVAPPDLTAEQRGRAPWRLQCVQNQDILYITRPQVTNRPLTNSCGRRLGSSCRGEFGGCYIQRVSASLWRESEVDRVSADSADRQETSRCTYYGAYC